MSGEKVTSINHHINRSRRNPVAVMQVAAEAGSETKRLIPADAEAIQGPHRNLIVGGLQKIFSGEYGPDYHGITPAQAETLLHHYEWPLSAEEVSA